MSRWLMVTGMVVGSVAAAAALAVGVGRMRWNRETAAAFARLEAATPAAPASPSSASELERLPPPVRRYFAFALPAGGPRIRAARVRWSGEFQSRPGGGWAPFTAEQRFTVDPPGFVWDARIRMLPLLPVRVRDGYRGGAGTMLGRIGAVVPVVDAGGTPEIARSALARWLGEAAWFPTALLPGGPVAWAPIDDWTARATVTDGAVVATADFHFAPGGEILRMTALRYRDVGGAPVLTPFEGVYGRYERRGGVMVPSAAEVAWILPDGRFPYWRGRPETIEYSL